MKVLFLDIDGVLNNRTAFGRDNPASFFYMAPENVATLLELLRRAPDLRIVISSAWRYGRTVPELRRVFERFGLPGKRIVGKTPESKTREVRGLEVQAWLVGHSKVKAFVIVDDDQDMAHLTYKLVRTDSKVGLHLHHISSILSILGD